VQISFTSPISMLPGVGKRRAEMFAKLSLYTAGDLLRHFPRAYQHRGNIRLLSECEDGDTAAFLLTVATEPKTVRLKNRMYMTKFTVFDDSGKASVVFFNQNYLDDIFEVGDTFRFFGKISSVGRKYTLSAPDYEKYDEEKPLPEFIPVYPLTEGLSQKMMRKIIGSALDGIVPDTIPEPLPSRVIGRHKLCSAEYALRAIHDPRSYEMIDTAKRRLAFEELYLFSLGAALMKDRIKTNGAHPMPSGSAMLNGFAEKLPFRLTSAQIRSVKEIAADMAESTPMTRLLSGDVGSGKTAVAAAAAYVAVKNGFSAAMMAPTEILASQHYKELSSLFGDEISVELLTGSTTKKEKTRILSALEAGNTDLIVGTHALLSEEVNYKNLGLVITDEQHRFGVMQRAALAAKAGGDVHMLVMSATPIPRSLALILYGDLDLSVLDELPPGRQKVDTYLVGEGMRDRIDRFIEKQAAEGGQVYVVCPAVAENFEEGEISFDDLFLKTKEKPKMKNAEAETARLREKFPTLSVEYVHGKMKSTEKSDVMNRFAAGEVNVLVSTTVIEVGVNVPNATLMIIENAERFGLSQLHQLRGRVGRGKKKSYCILISDSKGETAESRLSVMCETNDGYKIAEKDLAIRGPGDFFPSKSGEARQHGSFRFRVAALCDDMALLKAAAEDAAETVAEDPRLELPHNAAAKQSVFHLMETEMGTVS